MDDRQGPYACGLSPSYEIESNLESSFDVYIGGELLRCYFHSVINYLYIYCISLLVILLMKIF